MRLRCKCTTDELPNHLGAGVCEFTEFLRNRQNYLEMTAHTIDEFQTSPFTYVKQCAKQPACSTNGVTPCCSQAKCHDQLNQLFCIVTLSHHDRVLFIC